MKIVEIYKMAFYISLGLYVLSLTQHCFCTSGFCAYSIMALLSGGIGFVFGGAALTWLANPALFIAWFSIKKNPKTTLIASLLAVVISISFLFFNKVMIDEAGNYSTIISRQLGYWLWVASSAVMFIGCVLSIRKI